MFVSRLPTSSFQKAFLRIPLYYSLIWGCYPSKVFQRARLPRRLVQKMVTTLVLVNFTMNSSLVYPIFNWSLSRSCRYREGNQQCRTNAVHQQQEVRDQLVDPFSINFSILNCMVKSQVLLSQLKYVIATKCTLAHFYKEFSEIFHR